MELTEVIAYGQANLIVIDASTNDRIRFFICPQQVRESAEEVGDWYISWLRTHARFTGYHRRFSLRFFEDNRTLRPWEQSIMLTERGCMEVGCREIPFIERLAFTIR
jgi:hypothetical protein